MRTLSHTRTQSRAPKPHTIPDYFVIFFNPRKCCAVFRDKIYPRHRITATRKARKLYKFIFKTNIIVSIPYKEKLKY